MIGGGATCAIWCHHQAWQGIWAGKHHDIALPYGGSEIRPSLVESSRHVQIDNPIELHKQYLHIVSVALLLHRWSCVWRLVSDLILFVGL
jgi:hypothetical protein